jgi:PhnB protein
VNNTRFVTINDEKNLQVMRDFDAPIDRVWEAFTTQELLEQWWAPEPWKVRTKTFDFREGGKWLYAMVGPEGEEQWGLEEFVTIDPLKSFTVRDNFSDEKGNPDPELPSIHWKFEFEGDQVVTQLRVNLTTKTSEDLKKISEMGFKEGFSQALNQLERLLA